MCGIVGVINSASSSPAALEIFQGLLTLQHRGQDAAGIVSFDSKIQKFFQKKDLGLVSQVFTAETLEQLAGNIAIGHTRYATTGGDGSADTQPLLTSLPFGVAMTHNGNLVNYHSLARYLKGELKQQLLTSNDLEVILNLWCHHLFVQTGAGNQPILFEHCVEATRKIFSAAKGAYAVVGLIAGTGLFAFRDPAGIRPLVLGRRQSERDADKFDYCVCSETTALNFFGLSICARHCSRRSYFNKRRGRSFFSNL